MKKIILAQHDEYNSPYAFNLGNMPFPANGDYCIVNTRAGFRLVKVIMSGYIDESDEFVITRGQGKITADVIKVISKKDMREARNGV